VEEFKSKLDQITGANRKGMMVVSGALQRAALQYARSQGIGVVRLLPGDQVQYLLYQMLTDNGDGSAQVVSNENQAAFTEPDFVGSNRDFYAEADGHTFESWFSVLQGLLGRYTACPASGE
jgi:hypothetical protein